MFLIEDWQFKFLLHFSWSDAFGNIQIEIEIIILYNPIINSNIMFQGIA